MQIEQYEQTTKRQQVIFTLADLADLAIDACLSDPAHGFIGADEGKIRVVPGQRLEDPAIEFGIDTNSVGEVTTFFNHKNDPNTGDTAQVIVTFTVKQ
jgi:hypothetical protein